MLTHAHTQAQLRQCQPLPMGSNLDPKQIPAVLFAVQHRYKWSKRSKAKTMGLKEDYQCFMESISACQWHPVAVQGILFAGYWRDSHQLGSWFFCGRATSLMLAPVETNQSKWLDVAWFNHIKSLYWQIAVHISWRLNLRKDNSVVKITEQ